MRVAGTFQAFPRVSISAGVAPIVSLVRGRLVLSIPDDSSAMRRIRIRRKMRLAKILVPYWYLLLQNIATSLQTPGRAAFAREIGNMVTTWAWIEYLLDHINYRILHRGEGYRIQKDIPISLNPKIAFFRKSFERLPVLSGLKDRALMIVTRLDDLKKQRHDLIHGSIRRLYPSGVGKIARITYDGPLIIGSEITYRLKDVIEITKEMRQLGRELRSFANDVHAALPKKANYNPSC